MRRLGKVYNKTSDGLLVVESELKDPRRLVGSFIYDEELRKIGKIIDIIGRVDSPYIIIKPIKKEFVDKITLGASIYYRISRKQSRRSKRPRKKKRGGGRRGVHR